MIMNRNWKFCVSYKKSFHAAAMKGKQKQAHFDCEENSSIEQIALIWRGELSSL